MRSAVALRSSCRRGRDIVAITLARTQDVRAQVRHRTDAFRRQADPSGKPRTDVAQIAAEPSRFQEAMMNMTLSLAPLVSLLAGILILVVPRLLNYIVAIYLIVIGLLGLFGAGNFHLK